jgi:hypothetical protein
VLLGRDGALTLVATVSPLPWFHSAAVVRPPATIAPTSPPTSAALMAPPFCFGAPDRFDPPGAGVGAAPYPSGGPAGGAGGTPAPGEVTGAGTGPGGLTQAGAAGTDGGCIVGAVGGAEGIDGRGIGVV